jgi:hypothetical protein
MEYSFMANRFNFVLQLQFAFTAGIARVRYASTVIAESQPRQSAGLFFQ